jgi:hypothetical protein
VLAVEHEHPFSEHRSDQWQVVLAQVDEVLLVSDGLQARVTAPTLQAAWTQPA